MGDLERLVLVSGATADALAQRMGRTFTDAEAQQAEVLIRDAAMLISRRVDLHAKPPEVVRSALLQTVAFYLSVVDVHVTSETVAVDDATHTVRRAAAPVTLDGTGMQVPSSVWTLLGVAQKVGSTMVGGGGVSYFGGTSALGRSW